MDITKVSESDFKIKGKHGVALATLTGPTISNFDGETLKSFTTAGEYEVSGISIIGIKTEEGNVFVYELDGFRICHLGNVTKKLSDAKISSIGDIDILIVPVNEVSIELTQSIESYYILPFGYKNEEELDKFVKESGFNTVTTNKFSIKKGEIIEDSTAQIIILNGR